MGLAEKIANRVTSPKDKETKRVAGRGNQEADEGPGRMQLKPGDLGKRAIAAIKANDHEAYEEAIRAIVGEDY